MSVPNRKADLKIASIRDYFQDELKAVMERQKVSTHELSFDYLVDLLVQSMDSQKFFATNAEGKLEDNFLVDLYRQYKEGNHNQQIHSLKRLGDVCLMIAGFFPDSLNRKLVDLEYYQGMGTSAYSHLSNYQLHEMARSIYKELSEKFKNLSDVFQELSERSLMQSNTDLLRLYEKWQVTGSKHIRDILKEKGIHNPFVVDPKIKH